MHTSEYRNTEIVKATELRAGDSVIDYGTLIELAELTYDGDDRGFRVVAFRGIVRDWFGREDGRECPLHPFCKTTGAEWTVQGSDLRTIARVVVAGA